MLRKLTILLKFKSNHEYCLSTSAKLHTHNKLLQKEDIMQSEDNKHVNTVEILNKYKKDEEKILNIVNNYNLSELLCYDISKNRANKLLAWRMRNGLLKNLGDIVTIEGFGPKITDKFYKSLLQEPKISKLNLCTTSKSRAAPFIIPSLAAGQRDMIKSCVSIKIGVNSITWARLEVPGQEINTPCELTDWDHHEISEKKLHINDLIQRCLYIIHLIPSADCYIFENPQMAQASNNPGSVEQQNINIQKAQVIGIISYALASRNKIRRGHLEHEEYTEEKYVPNIFYLKRFLTARLFNHLVGMERVSSEQTVLSLMRTFYNTSEMNDEIEPIEKGASETVNDKYLPTKELNFSGHVQFPIEFRQMFSKSSPYCREYLGQALLLNLAFVRLVLLQDAESIALVTKGNKKNNLNYEP